MRNTNNSSRSYARFAAKLLLGTSLAGLAATTALAQNENVTVTGSSIRGAAPVGANIISVDRTAIEASGAQTVQQLLTSVPQLTSTFGTAGVGGGNTDGGTGSFTPTIHNIGGGASIATLVLIDGHRVPGTGLTVWGVDPSLLPTIMIQRVEVLPDGASSIYGADALAGVVNFITRKDYSGWETSAQYGIADRYNTFSASQVFGHNWDGGSVTAGYTYSNRSQLGRADRDFITARQDLRWGLANPADFTGVSATPPAGARTTTPAAGPGSTGPYGATIPYLSAGTNFQNFNCPVAAISNTNSSDVFIYPYTVGDGRYVTTTGVPPQGVCDTTKAGSVLPSEVKNLAMVAMRQSITDRITMNADLVYAVRRNGTRNARGTVNGNNGATVFNPAGTGGPAFGSNQKNPFYVGVPGAAATATSQLVRFSFDDLIPGTTASKNGSTQAFAALGLDVDLGSQWAMSVGTTFGTNTDFNRQSGAINNTQVYLALNGTNNANGTGNTTLASSAIVDPYGLGTIVGVTRALTTANALDVWNPAATNRTSASVLRSLTDSTTNSVATKSLQDVVIKFDGPLFDLPAGPIRAAFGVEYTHSQQDEYGSTNSTAGPASTSSGSFYYSMQRTAYAAFAEFIVPVISEDAGIPLMRKFTMNFSGRYDNFDDAGNTKNPKVGFTWEILDGLQARGTYGTSFVVVDIHHTGVAGSGTNSESAVNAAGTPSNPIIPFSTTAPSPYNNFAGVAGTWVDTAATCKAGGGQPVNAAGTILTVAPFTGATGCRIAFGSTTTATQSAALNITGGNPNLKPPTGLSYSAGIDFDAGRFLPFLDGLIGHVTYYESKFMGLNTSVGTQNGRLDLTTFAPPGGWAATDPVVQNFIAGRPLRLPLPGVVWALFDGRQQNAYTLWQNGLDFSVNYRFNIENFGDFNFGMSGNQVLRQSQAVFAPGAIPADTKNGKNSPRFSSPEFTGSANLGWRLDAVSAGLSVNYQRTYWATNNSFPWNLSGPGRLAGYEKIPANVTVDLSASYILPDSIMSGTQLQLNIDNLLDTDPPKFDNANGYTTGNPIGRYFTFGLRKKW